MLDKIDTNEPDPNLICQVHFETGQWSDIVTPEQAFWILEQIPFASLHGWNGHAWEVLFDGAVEFSGVTP